MPSNNVTTNEPGANGIGPGDRLQAARVEQGLSIEDVANRMHLSVNVLESIEENNFDDITAPIFVKGYLRAYARIVSLSENDMIQQYIEFYSDEDPPINSTSSTSPEISSDDARVKWTTYIVILALCGLLAAWWWNKSQDRGDVVSLDLEQSEINSAEPTNDTAMVQEAEIVANSEETVESDSDMTNPEDMIKLLEKQADELNQAQILASSGVDSVVEQPVSTEEPPETETTPVIPETENETDIDTGTRTGTELGNTNRESDVSQTVATGSDIISLIIHADTWADIKDVGGNRLAYDLLRAERRLTLTGQAPFTVFFGNGHGVEMTYNGEEFDISSYIQDDNTARLKIGNN